VAIVEACFMHDALLVFLMYRMSICMPLDRQVCTNREDESEDEFSNIVLS